MSVQIGLTGGIGSGKSTVARLWAELGAHVVDSDAIARQLTMPGGGGMPALLAEFGTDVLAADGSLDRPMMRDRMLRDPAAKLRLEAILHPLIRQEVQAQAGLAQPGQPVVLDIPLLVESGDWADRVDFVLVVDCLEETQVGRVVKRSAWSETQVRAVMARQASRSARLAVADAVIFNEGKDLDMLRTEVNLLWQRWCGTLSPGGTLAVKQSNLC